MALDLFKIIVIHSDSIGGCQMYPNFVFFPPPPRVVGHVAHVLSEHVLVEKIFLGFPITKTKAVEPKVCKHPSALNTSHANNLNTENRFFPMQPA